MNTKTYYHTVASDLPAKYRLRSYIIGRFPLLDTSSSAKKAVKNGCVIINGRVGMTGDWVSADDIVIYNLEIPHKNTNEKIEVIFEDEFLMIVNKPPGIKSSGSGNNNFQTRLKHHPMSELEDSLPYPYLVHRLDRQTSGLMIAAKTMSARRSLGAMIEGRQLHKEYFCLVQGYLENKNRMINILLDEKEAVTEIIETKLLNTKDEATYVVVKIHTGRTHQIRRHMLSIGYPIVGDDIYNVGGVTFGNGLFLMASVIEFIHPISNEPLSFRLKPNNKFLKYI